MGSEISYKEIMNKIDKTKELGSDEKIVVKEAIDELFTRYAIGANGIVSMVKLTADKKTFETLRGIVGRARERVRVGKAALTPADKNALHQCLSYMKRESIDKISKPIEDGNYLFLSLLHRELSNVDLEEVHKLQKIIEGMRQY